MTTSPPPGTARPADLGALLHGWLPQQRWFGGKGRTVDAVAVEVLADEDLPAVPAARILLAVASATFADAPHAEHYQVPLLLAPPGTVTAEFAHLGDVPRDGGVWAVYDALREPHCSQWLLSRMRLGATAGSVDFSGSPDLPDVAGSVLSAEQSNTSVVFGEQLIAKFFRRLSPGVNPDLVLTAALAQAQVGHVATPRGDAHATVAGERTTLALLQDFYRDGTDGWKLATASVRDLYAEADLHADEVGGDFAAEAHRLGAATADVHRALAALLPAGTAGTGDVEEVRASVRARLAQASADIEPVAALRDALDRRLGALTFDTVPLGVQRIHGDYHLGQVLRTGEGWVILDFEGEPARPLAERVTLHSPWRDVAGMLRSFDYAARAGLVDHPRGAGLTYRAAEWAARNRAAFLAGYTAGDAAGLTPAAPLLDLFELDKALYEAQYELRNRPSWLSIPLAALTRIAHEE